MNTQDAIFNGDQHVSESRQERTLQEEKTGRSIDEIGTEESTSPVQIPHHKTCCCQTCWPKNMNSYL
jgi:hypothetical protein